MFNIHKRGLLQSKYLNGGEPLLAGVRSRYPCPNTYLCVMLTLTVLFLESLGGGELLLILVFVLIFFGSKNIPSLARGLGKGIREMKDAMNGVQNEIRKGMDDVEREGGKILADEEISDVKPQSTPLPVVLPEERSASRSADLSATTGSPDK